MTGKLDPDGTRLPIKVDTTSNGEYVPKPLAKHNKVANEHAHTEATEKSRHKGQDRRSFLISSCGAASTLLAFNEAHAAFGKTGGYYDLPTEAGLDQDLAMSVLQKDEFIFDIQGHHVGRVESWKEGIKKNLAPGFKLFAPHTECDYADEGRNGHLRCIDGDAYIKEVFMDSDTDMAVLTFGPLYKEKMVPEYSEGAATREAVEALEGTHRLLMHGRCMATIPSELDAMAETAETYGIVAFKTYTQYGANRTDGYFLDDDLGNTFISRARDSGVNIICVHKGLPFPAMAKETLKYSTCRDIGPAAKNHPDMSFMVYHSGYDHDVKEGPHDPKNTRGVDGLINSLIDNGITPANNTNVYAELGTTWRDLMKDPDQAAHVMGKLLLHVGEDKISWGTDCIWYGSPQDQIQAFRTFQISEEFQEKYGYPKITDEIRKKIFGLNSAVAYNITPDEVKMRTHSDIVTTTKQAYLEQPDPSFITYGPRTRREFFRLAEFSDH